MNITPISFIANQQSINDNEIQKLFDSFGIKLCNINIAKSQIDKLADSIRNGSSKDLEYLVNIMFHENKEISLYATNQLYLIYSKLNNSIRGDIKEFIKSLYEIKVRDDKEYFKERPLLSAMACGDAIAGQQGKGNNVFISAIDNYLNIESTKSVFANNAESVSSSNRYISASELQSWVSLQSYQCDIGHYETILNKIEKNNKSDELKNHVVLVNGNHWVALFTYKNSCFLCDSLSSNKEDNDERHKLLSRLEKKGFNTFNIEDNLQKNVPNGCGLFALNYIDSLQNELNNLNNGKETDLTSTIETVLHNTGKNFLNLSDEEQTTFNHDFRKTLIMDTLFNFLNLVMNSSLTY
ncbi:MULTISPECIES: hypothetical protein [Proteus]|uniref:hypothetical protein n=1 Tax=Proteus TaxID=583 RepID=UPI000D6E1D8C|nr:MULTISPECIES: hypothetical protein [Proteus]NBM11075.1 hypothetical protein [Proteus sp. G2670]NBM31898.1 hypothetical protein [Proteus sp. G2664]NBM87386.1 hypothetical protein [Proteus sp. G2661]NBM95242.1 hypothetical protein [Proteus sp. G2662]NBM97355.1 hypothetical protein [Proteus sp. G2660]